MILKAVKILYRWLVLFVYALSPQTKLTLPLESYRLLTQWLTVVLKYLKFCDYCYVSQCDIFPLMQHGELCCLSFAVCVHFLHSNIYYLCYFYTAVQQTETASELLLVSSGLVPSNHLYLWLSYHFICTILSNCTWTLENVSYESQTLKHLSACSPLLLIKYYHNGYSVLWKQ